MFVVSIMIVLNIYYRPQRSCGKVMLLHLSVILSRGGAGADTTGGQTPSGSDTPWEQTPPPNSSPPPPADTPTQCMLGDTGSKRAVRILLECILVFLLTLARILRSAVSLTFILNFLAFINVKSFIIVLSIGVCCGIHVCGNLFTHFEFLNIHIR